MFRRILRWAARIAASLAILVLMIIGVAAITTSIADARAITARPEQTGSLLVPLADGRKVHFRALGLNHDGPAVILLPCLTCGSAGWQSVQSQLADSMRVYAYDPAGFGWSDASDDVSMQSAADDLHEALVALGEQGIVLVGHSSGSLIMHFYVNQYPASPHILGLMWAEGDDYSAASMELYGEPSTIPMGLVNTLVDLGLARPLFPMLAGGSLPAPAEADAHTQTYLDRIQDVGISRGNLRTMFKVITHYPVDLQEAATLELPRSVPIYVIDADDSSSYTSLTGEVKQQYEDDRAEWLRKLVEESPNGQYIEVANSGHFVMVDQPEQVLAIIQDFYSTVSNTQEVSSH